jgi:hypothetical protein
MCAIPGTPEAALNSSTAVFTSKLTDIINTTNPTYNFIEYTYVFEVIKIYKGNISNQVNIKYICDALPCEQAFFTNKEYLVYAYELNDELWVSGCGRTKLLSLATEEVEKLDNLVSEQRNCKNLYWFDNENKSCGQKEFCGVYMYYGLQTFDSRTQCEKALKPEENNNQNKTFTLSNRREAEIKIMPGVASERAIERLGELNFTIELKEVGNDKVAYELTGNKQGKFLGIFKIMGKVQLQVDAETGIVKEIKPWWSFLASGI